MKSRYLYTVYQISFFAEIKNVTQTNIPKIQASEKALPLSFIRTSKIELQAG